MCVANAWYNLIPPSKTVKITMSHIFAVDEQEHYRHFFFFYQHQNGGEHHELSSYFIWSEESQAASWVKLALLNCIVGTYYMTGWCPCYTCIGKDGKKDSKKKV